MAMPSTARRSDPHSRGFHTDIEPPHSPRATTQTSRPTTPRPSISPLSTASKAAKSSPIAPRDLNMSGVELQRGGDDDHQTNGDVADLADDRSSSLSDPEDEPDDDMLQNGIRQDMAAAEELAAQQSLEGDSEAETERLEQTPHRLRKHADSVGKTPSKLSQAATIDDELSDPPSPLPARPGAASSTSTTGTLGMSMRMVDRDSPHYPQTSCADRTTTGNKRKRSNSDDSSLTSADSDFDESPRKRSHASPADEGTTTTDGADLDVNETTELPEHELGADEERETPVASAKGGRGRKGKVKGKMRKESTKELESETMDETTQADEDHGEEITGKNVEEVRHKHEASTLFEHLTKQFSAFREKLFSERLAALNAELDMLAQPECKHPEYLRQVACVDTRYTKQVTEVQAFFRYKTQTLRKSTLGERAQLHGQYFQNVRELREDVLSKLGDDWYNIQKERRQSNQADDEAYVYKFPTKKSVQLRQQAKYNQEVSVLSGVAKYVGFPAAPDIAGAASAQLEDDLKAMKINKRALQQPQPQTQPQLQPPPTTHNQVPFLSFGNGKMAQTSSQITQQERLAHEQFVEQNAWARPQGTIHTHGTPNLTHTPDWAEPVTHHSSKHLIRGLGGGLQHVSPFSTPIPQRRLPVDHSGAIPSDPIEPPSSVQPAPPTSERLHQYYRPDNTSPISIAKFRHHAPSGASELAASATATGGVGGFRNVSGASTIDAPPESSSTEKKPSQAQPHPPSSPLSSLSRPPAPGHAAGDDQLTTANPPSIFETGQFHLSRHGSRPPPPPSSSSDMYPGHTSSSSSTTLHPGFRPRDGAFGTPASFGTTPASSITLNSNTTNEEPSSAINGA